jgi:hypothetical protein
MKAYWRSGGISPRILNLGNGLRQVVAFALRPLYPREKEPPYPLGRRLGGPQFRSGRGGVLKKAHSIFFPSAMRDLAIWPFQTRSYIIKMLIIPSDKLTYGISTTREMSPVIQQNVDICPRLGRPLNNRSGMVWVGIENGYELVDRIIGVQFPVGAGNFTFRHRVQTGSGAYPDSYPVSTGGSFPGSKAAGTWNWPLTSI